MTPLWVLVSFCSPIYFYYMLKGSQYIQTFFFVLKSSAVEGLEWYEGEQTMTIFIFEWTIPFMIRPGICSSPIDWAVWHGQY